MRPPTHGNGRTVLVADDEPLIRQAMQRTLGDAGYHVTTASSGPEVLELLRRSHVDLLITDIGMPGLDGLAVVDAAREISPHTSSILVTGNMSLESARKAARHGAYDYLTKPFTAAELLDAAEAALARKAEENHRAREQELEDLFRLSERVRTAEDPEELLRVTTATAVMHTNSDAGCLATLRDERLWPHVMRVGARRGNNAPQPAEFLRVAREQPTPILYAPSRHHPLTPIIPDVRDPSDSVFGPVAEALVLPIISSRKPKGALGVARFEERPPYGRADYQTLSVLAAHLGLLLSNMELVQSLQHAYVGTVRSMALMVEARDRYTRGHSQRVADLCWRLANLFDVGPAAAATVRTAAELHDVGKVGVPDSILHKRGALTEAEWRPIRDHPVVGAQILRPAAFLSDVLPLVLHHHERYDGTGYPDGVKGESIPLLAHVLIASDAWDAMTSDRPYRPALTTQQALAELAKGRGTQFHPRVADAMLHLLS